MVPGAASLDDKIQKLVDTNKKMRKDYEELEQTIYTQRHARNARDSANVIPNQGVDDVNSRFFRKFCIIIRKKRW